MNQRLKRAAPWSTLAVAAAMLLTSCGSSAPTDVPGDGHADAAANSTTDLTPVSLHTSVPAAYMAAAVAGSGWQSQFRSNTTAASRGDLTGDFLLNVEDDGNGHIVQGVNANTGELAIDVRIPKLEFAEGMSQDGPTRTLRHGGKEYVVIVQAGTLQKGDGLSKPVVGYRATFLEAAEGAKPIDVDVPITRNGDDHAPTVFEEPDTGVLKSVTPEGVKEFKPGKVAGVQGGLFNTEKIHGVSPDGEAIRVRAEAAIDGWGVDESGNSTGEDVDLPAYIRIGDWDVTKGALGAEAAQAEEVQLHVVDDDRLYFTHGSSLYFADMGTQKTKLIAEVDPDEFLPEDVNNSPDRRYAILETIIYDVQEDEPHDLSADGNRMNVYPVTISDDGIAYGNTDEAVVSYDATTREFTSEGDLTLKPVSLTSSGTLVLEGTDMPLQGVRKQ